MHGVADLVRELRLAALLQVLDGRAESLGVVVDEADDVVVPLLAGEDRVCVG